MTPPRESSGPPLGDRLVEAYVGGLLFMAALGVFPRVVRWAARGWRGED